MATDELDALRTVEALRSQAAGLSAQIANAEKVLADARAARDTLIKEFRAKTKLSIPKIAEAAGVSESTVKAVLR